MIEYDNEYSMSDSAIKMVWIILSILLIGMTALVLWQHRKIDELQTELKRSKQNDWRPIIEKRK